MTLLHHILYRLGWDICPKCGSRNIIRRETVDSSRIECRDCGAVTLV